MKEIDQTVILRIPKSENRIQNIDSIELSHKRVWETQLYKLEEIIIEGIPFSWEPWANEGSNGGNMTMALIKTGSLGFNGTI